MSEVLQNTLYLTVPGTIVSKSKQTLKIHLKEENVNFQVPIHNLKSICTFGPIRITPNVLNLCLNHQVSVYFHTQNGFLLGQVFGSGDTRYLIRQSQYAKAQNPNAAREVASIFVAGKLQNSRLNLLRARRESRAEDEQKKLSHAITSLARLIQQLHNTKELPSSSTVREALDPIRGVEGIAAKTYFNVFTYMIKQQREDFSFSVRTRRPPLDRINCMLSFLYALVLSDCLTALSVVGIDPYVGWLHTTRAGRPACALDLMEEFRPHVERLAITLINRKQIQHNHFRQLAGGAVELSDSGRKIIISAWQERKQVKLKHELFEEKIYMGQMFWVQARLLSRWLRGDIPHYVPFLSS